MGAWTSVREARQLLPVTLRKEVMWLARAAGVPHPSMIPLEDFEVLDDRLGSKSAREHFGYGEGWGLPPEPELVRLRRKPEPAAAE
ncbi:MAG: hypothetical protein R3B82_07615 [Sandaracinaceae bacterium]